MIDTKKLVKHVDKIDWPGFGEKQTKTLGAYVISGMAWLDHNQNPVCGPGTWAVVLAERTLRGINIISCLHSFVKTRQEAKWLQTIHTMGEGLTEEERHDPEFAQLARMMPLGEFFKALVKLREKKAREKERVTKLITGV